MGNDKTKSVATPVDLIVANTTHEMVAFLEQNEDATSALTNVLGEILPGLKDKLPQFDAKKDHYAEEYARQLLCNIANQATRGVVLKALEAIGAPSVDSEIWARIDAAREVQKREAEIAPATH